MTEESTLQLDTLFTEDELCRSISTEFSSDELQKLSLESLGARLHYKAEKELVLSTTPPYWSYLKREFYILVCTSDKKYADLRRQLAASSGKSQVALISLISAAAASSIGIAAGILTPFCALCVLALLRMGKEAFCNAKKLDVPFIER